MVGVQRRCLLALSLTSVAGAVDYCSHPSGGTIPLIYSGCVAGTDHCFNWMNAKCDRGWCVCKEDQCIMEGQCVPKGECPSLTGGTCALQGCDSWRNATCSESSVGTHEAHCMCGLGTCPTEGECRAPGDCAKSTGGTCNVLSCNSWRKSTCSVKGAPGPTEEARCMCGHDSCPINGECVKKGSCPSYTGSSCKVFKTTGLLPCAVGKCNDDANCVCPDGQCYVDGKCVDSDTETIALSVQWGRSQEASARQSSPRLKGGLLLLSVASGALLSMFTSLILVKRALRARQAAASPVTSDYESLEG